MVINDLPEDSFVTRGKRLQLVQTLKEQGITDKAVLDAIGTVPRHYFINPMYVDHAYDNKPLPIEKNQTISQPYTVAFQTQLLEIKKGEKVLEIGTGSGYQAAVLLHLGAKVYSIERHSELFNRTKQLFSRLGLKAHLYYGDGYKGLPVYAPFDKILITAAAPEVPEELLKQLATGGILVVPINKGDSQVMTTFKKMDAKNFEVKRHGRFSFVPMLKGKE